ncbi:hypothetical protein [Streptomyces sp. NPDC059874]|uniref:hypothetical protein n=1 Tax=Streptomyces sp. NPDC059874 TaxID=3346983 RepID=UPI003648BD44
MRTALVTDLSFAGVDGVPDTLPAPGAVNEHPDAPAVRIDQDVVAWRKTFAPPARRGASL